MRDDLDRASAAFVREMNSELVWSMVSNNMCVDHSSELSISNEENWSG